MSEFALWGICGVGIAMMLYGLPMCLLLLVLPPPDLYPPLPPPLRDPE